MAEARTALLTGAHDPTPRSPVRNSDTVVQQEHAASSLPAWVWTVKKWGFLGIWAWAKDRSNSWESRDVYFEASPSSVSLFSATLQAPRGEEMPWNTQFWSSASELSVYGGSWFLTTAGKAAPQDTPVHMGWNLKAQALWFTMAGIWEFPGKPP